MVGEKCYLSPVNVKDAEEYSSWFNNFEIAKNLMIFDQQMNTLREEKFLENCDDSRNHFFAIIDSKTDQLVGNVGLHKVNMIDRKADIGIVIGDKTNHHKGYGTEGLRLCLDFAFNYLNLHNIFLEVYSYNDFAPLLYKKVGFKEIGKNREAKLINGKFYDVIFMDILASEFESPYINKFFEDEK